MDETYSDRTYIQGRLSSDASMLSTPKIRESSEDFEEGFCGEPLMTQHVKIDFRPGDQDTDFDTRKCIAFWEFINNCPELRDTMVLSEVVKYPDTESLLSSSETASFKYLKSNKKSSTLRCNESSTLPVFKTFEKKGTTKNCFMAPLRPSMCIDGERGHSNDVASTTVTSKSSTREDGVELGKPKVHKNIKKGKKSKTSKKSDQKGKEEAEELQRLCQQMDEWDSRHPKSMEPPGIMHSSLKFIPKGHP